MFKTSLFLILFSMMYILFLISIETEDEREYYPQEERLQLSGLQGFSLGYRVTWPVSLVLDRKTIACYQMIFRHLFYCKHVERLLCRCGVRDLSCPKYADFLAFSVIYSLRYKYVAMNTFSKLYNYFFFFSSTSGCGLATR